MVRRPQVLRRWVGRLWRLVQGVAGLFPLTVAGLALGGLSIFALVRYGEGRSDFVLHSASLVALAVLSVCVGLVVLGALALALSLTAARRVPLEGSVEVGGELLTGFRFARLAYWPLVRLRMSWVEPALKTELIPEGRRALERVSPVERGRLKRVARRFEVTDLFGLASVSFTVKADVTLRFCPSLGPADLALALRHASGEGYSHPAGRAEGERVEMRPYAPGDPLRLVLWPVFARTRRLLVRTPEQAVVPKPSSVAYFVAGPGDEPSASTARVFLEQGFLGDDFVFSADGAEHPVNRADRAVELIIDSVAHRARGGADLGRLLNSVNPVSLENCVLFVPGEPGPWQAQVAAFVAKLPKPPLVLVTVSGRVERAPGRLKRWLVVTPKAQRGSLKALPALYAGLAAMGGPVRVLQGDTGALLSEAEITALNTLSKRGAR